jgi:4-carboxymuconolactone decarboxylase
LNGRAKRRARVPLLELHEMTPDQRAVHESVVSGPRGRMIGPLLAAIHSPELAVLWSQFGEYLRFGTCLPKRASELAILVCGRHWTSQVEWWVHSSAATDAGLPDAVIEAIRTCRSPQFTEAAELEVYEYARALLRTGQVPEELHTAVLTRWGTRGVVELTGVIGYYSLVAMTLNAHEIPVPDTDDEPLPRTAGLVELPEGRLTA